MSIHMINNGWATSSLGSGIDYIISNEFVGPHLFRKMSGTLTLPSLTAGQFAWIYLYCNADGSGKGIGAVNVGTNLLHSFTRPNHAYVRVIAAWGTTPGSTSLMRQIVNNNVVVYAGDFVFDVDIGEDGADPPGGYVNNAIAERSSQNGWPANLCAAVYIRGEAMRDTGDGSGLSQGNVVGVHDTDGSVAGPPSMGFITQWKAYSEEGEGGENSHDWLRVPIGPGASKWWVRAANNTRAFIAISGYEMMATLHTVS